MSRFRAPRARRTPISWVRSTTLTSMMFMITMPPTPRLTEEMRISRMKATLLMACHSSWRLSWVRMPKGSASL